MRQLRADLAMRQAGGILGRIIPALGFLFLWIPIIVLIVFSFNNSRSNAVWAGFTTDWYTLLFSGQFSTERRFSTEFLVAALQNSLVIGLISTFISTILGTLMAIGLERFQFRGRRLIDLIMYLPVVIPEVTMGLSLQIFFSVAARNINNTFGTSIPTLSILTVIIGHVVFCMPFVTITVRARLAGMPKNYEDAARDLGANEWTTFRRVTLPLLMPGILAGALLALTLSLDDFVVTLFTAGPGTTTLPVFVYGMIKFGVNPSINAISTLIVAVSMSLVLFSIVAQRNRT
ncbi:MAG: ABC transporter permease [Anaerolineae bacterium]|nr:ABC transporter permease [Anaerolineae bacterium]